MAKRSGEEADGKFGKVGFDLASDTGRPPELLGLGGGNVAGRQCIYVSEGKPNGRAAWVARGGGKGSDRNGDRDGEAKDNVVGARVMGEGFAKTSAGDKKCGMPEGTVEQLSVEGAMIDGEGFVKVGASDRKGGLSEGTVGARSSDGAGVGDEDFVMTGDGDMRGDLPEGTVDRSNVEARGS